MTVAEQRAEEDGGIMSEEKDGKLELVAPPQGVCTPIAVAAHYRAELKRIGREDVEVVATTAPETGSITIQLRERRPGVSLRSMKSGDQ